MDKVIETKSQMIMRIADLSEANERLQAEYDDLQVSHSILGTAYLELKEETERLEAELKKYEDMAKKGLEEFKDVGGCWGCGLQLQLNQDIEDIKKLKAENEKLKTDIGIYKGIIDSDKEENERLKSIVESNNQQVEQAELLVMDNDRLQQEVENLKDTIYYDVEKYRQTLQEIREIADNQKTTADYTINKIIEKINEVMGVKE